MRAALRTVVLLTVFVAVGWLAARGVMDHVASRGVMQPEVRLAGAMAGLFAGGAAVMIAGIAMVWARGRS
jgi:hypothetical protein